MADDEGGHQEDPVGPNRIIHVDVDLVKGHHLSLLRGAPPHHLHPHGGADDHAFPQVSDADHKTQLAVSEGDDCVLAEDERLRAPMSLRSFHEDAAQHDGVDDQSHDVLHYEDDDGRDALLRDHPTPEADGHLDFYGEEEGGGEGVDVRYARDKIIPLFTQVSVRKSHKPPDHPEQEPAA